MQDKWYGDKRDLVKWGVLLHLAHSYRAKRILQVAYLQQDLMEYHLEIDGQKQPVPQSVINHFRNIHNVKNLSHEPRIEVLDLRFKDRRQYKQAIVKNVDAGQHPCIVFLDPDTGLEPQGGRAGLEHVLDSELADIWKELSKGDVLVFYQHQTNRRGQPWIEQKRAQFEKALRLPCGSATLARSPDIARDVAFYYCRKEKVSNGNRKF